LAIEAQNLAEPVERFELRIGGNAFPAPCGRSQHRGVSISGAFGLTLLIKENAMATGNSVKVLSTIPLKKFRRHLAGAIAQNRSQAVNSGADSKGRTAFC
jgi:hypothetical protein